MATLSFKGKSIIQNYHLGAKYHELVPVKAKSLTDKVSLNDSLIIHGDNLKALKALLPTYAGKITCVYIDPPYNTGKEGWRYNDNVNSPMMQEWLGKTVDLEDLTRHDKWLCMMMPRLKLIRELMADDAAAFVSVDDNELYDLRLLLDEVFGNDNWVGTIVWKNVTDNNPTNVAIEHEYVVCFCKNRASLPVEWKSRVSAAKDALIRIGRELNEKYDTPQALSEAYREWYRENKPYLWPLDRYKYIDKHGVYTGSQSVHNPGREGYRYDVMHPLTKKPCKQPLMGYRFPPETMTQLLSEGRVIFGDDESKIVELKLYAEEYEDKLASVMTLDGRLGAYELRNIFPEQQKSVFDNPKPVDFVEQLLSFAARKGAIVLDSFAGSGTTAHAVLSLNKQDQGERRFILVECEDYADSLTAERVRRVIRGIPGAKDEDLRTGLGGSFSFFELGQPIEVESILAGDTLPSYVELARYVFYTATGEEFLPDQVDEARHFIGASKDYDVYLLYKPDITYLKSTSLTLEVAKALGEYSGKKKLIFAPTKYLDLNDSDLLAKHGLKGIEYCQLPFEIYRLKG